jgi:23S rRNA G2069 N7-methylase RlmK/C1962 C5-methylase RlmI
MKTFISLKDVHRVTHIDGDELTGIVVDYIDQCQFRHVRDISKANRDAKDHFIEKYGEIYEAIKNALEKGCRYIEIEL